MKVFNVVISSKRFIQAVKPHQPLIKFRKGGNTGSHESSAELSSQKISNARSVLEDYQLPRRYRRPLLDELEINAINSGGAYL